MVGWVWNTSTIVGQILSIEQRSQYSGYYTMHITGPYVLWLYGYMVVISWAYESLIRPTPVLQNVALQKERF